MTARSRDFDIGPNATFQSYPPQAHAELLTALIVSRLEAHRGKEPWIKVAGECLSPARVALALELYEAGAAIDV